MVIRVLPFVMLRSVVKELDDIAAKLEAQGYAPLISGAAQAAKDYVLGGLDSSVVKDFEPDRSRRAELRRYRYHPLSSEVNQEVLRGPKGKFLVVADGPESSRVLTNYAAFHKEEIISDWYYCALIWDADVLNMSFGKSEIEELIKTLTGGKASDRENVIIVPLSVSFEKHSKQSPDLPQESYPFNLKEAVAHLFHFDVRDALRRLSSQRYVSREEIRTAFPSLHELQDDVRKQLVTDGFMLQCVKSKNSLLVDLDASEAAQLSESLKDEHCCPYCGKSDRIKPLTRTASITESEAWSILSSRNRQPALCNFCLNVVLISDGTAMMPED